MSGLEAFGFRRAPAAWSALLLACLLQLTPLLFLGRAVGVSDILTLHPPWRSVGAPPPGNPLLDDAATGLHAWMSALVERGELLETSSVACGAVGPLAGVFGLLSPTVLGPFLALPRALALTGMTVLDAVLGFAAFYVWRRARGDRDLPAAIGAAIWGLAPARAVYRTWPYAGLTILFPLLLLAVDRELRPRDARSSPARRALLWAALAIGLVLGGHPSFALMGIYAAAAYGVARLASAATARREGAADARPSLGAPLAGVAVALLALSPVLALGRAFLVDGEWARLRESIAHAPPVPWRFTLLLFDPFFYGNPALGSWRGLGWAGPDNLVELQPYMGLATLLLVPLALAGTRRREAAFWAAAAALVALAIVAGGPFAAAARLLPGIATIFLSRLRLLLLLAAAALACIGTEALRAAFSPRLRLALPALLLFLTLDLSLANVRFEPHPDAPDAPPCATPALESLRALAPGGGHRFLAFGTAVVPNTAFELGLEDLRAHLLYTGGYRRLLGRLDPAVYGRRGTYLTFEPETFRPEPGLLDLLGVSALAAPPGTPAPGGDFTAAYRGPDADVYARPWRAPARLVTPSSPSLAEQGRVTRFAARGTRWDLDVDAPRGGTLLLGRTRLRHVDSARLDASSVALFEDPRAEGLIALRVPPGMHRVSVAPRLPAALAIASGAGCAGLLALALAAARGKAANVART